jgi:hypothetical protein
LIALATTMFVDEDSQHDGWEAFPTHKATSEHYVASELAKGRTQGPPHSSTDDGHPRKGGGVPSEFSPSAPDLFSQDRDRASGSDPDDVIGLEPGPWLPDSHAMECLNCHLEFRCGSWFFV